MKFLNNINFSGQYQIKIIQNFENNLMGIDQVLKISRILNVIFNYRDLNFSKKLMLFKNNCNKVYHS